MYSCELGKTTQIAARPQFPRLKEHVERSGVGCTVMSTSVLELTLSMVSTFHGLTGAATPKEVTKGNKLRAQKAPESLRLK